MLSVIGLEVVPFAGAVIEEALKLADARCGKPVTAAGEKLTVPANPKMPVTATL
jgi:hypothetical protein